MPGPLAYRSLTSSVVLLAPEQKPPQAQARMSALQFPATRSVRAGSVHPDSRLASFAGKTPISPQVQAQAFSQQCLLRAGGVPGARPLLRPCPGPGPGPSSPARTDIARTGLSLPLTAGPATLSRV